MSWIRLLRFLHLHCRLILRLHRRHYCYFSIRFLTCLRFPAEAHLLVGDLGEKMKRRTTIIIIIIIHFASLSFMIERPRVKEIEKRSKGQFSRQGISTGQKELPKNLETTHEAYRKGPIVVMIATEILLQTASSPCSYTFIVVVAVFICFFVFDVIILFNNSC